MRRRNVEKVKDWFFLLSLQKEDKVGGQILVNALKAKEDLSKLFITVFGDVRKILRAREELLK